MPNFKGDPLPSLPPSLPPSLGSLGTRLDFHYNYNIIIQRFRISRLLLTLGIIIIICLSDINFYKNAQIGRGKAEGARYVCDSLDRERERGGAIL